MGEYIRGVVVKLHLTPEQEVMFKQNYGCTRKTHNELLNKYKAKYGCVKCGERRFYLLDFHHTDPDGKDFSISDKSRCSLETMMKEIEKCDILCANCHREWHYLSSKDKNLTYDDWLGELV